MTKDVRGVLAENVLLKLYSVSWSMQFSLADVDHPPPPSLIYKQPVIDSIDKKDFGSELFQNQDDSIGFLKLTGLTGLTGETHPQRNTASIQPEISILK